MWTYSHTSPPTIWRDLTFLLLALLTLAAPLQNTAHVMICAHSDCHLPLRCVLCFLWPISYFHAYSVLQIPLNCNPPFQECQGRQQTQQTQDPCLGTVPGDLSIPVPGMQLCSSCLRVWPETRLSAYPRDTLLSLTHTEVPNAAAGCTHTQRSAGSTTHL